MSEMQVLYEAPGPRARRRNRILSVSVWIALAGVLAYVIHRFEVTGQLDPAKWEPFLYADIQRVLFEGLLNTLGAAVVASVLALALGVVFAVLRLSPYRSLRMFATACIELFRGLPVLLIMFAVYLLFEVTAFTAVVAGLAIFNGMVLAEIIRAGILAVPRGQNEAGLAIGLTPLGSLRLILMPQAFRSMLPTIISQIVVLLKDSALGFIVSFHELVYAVNQIGRAYHNLLPAFIVGAVIFIAINLAVHAIAVWLERRLSRSGR